MDFIDHKQDLPLKVNDSVYIFDDGKIQRAAKGKVISILNESALVVEFKPWGYGDDVIPQALVFNLDGNEYVTDVTEIEFTDKSKSKISNLDEMHVLKTSFSAPEHVWKERIANL